MQSFFALLLTWAAFAVAQSPGPAPSPTSVPSPAQTPAYNFVYRPTPSPATTPFPGPNAPAIAEIDLSDTTLVTPGTIHVRVLTSDPVTSVVAQTFGNTIKVPQKERGVFALDGYVPAIPDSLKNRSYDVEFIAAVADGRSVSVTLPLTLK